MSDNNEIEWQPTVNSNWKASEQKIDYKKHNQKFNENLDWYSPKQQQQIFKYIYDNYQPNFISKNNTLTPQAITYAVNALDLQPETMRNPYTYNATDELAKIFNSNKADEYKLKYNPKTGKYTYKPEPKINPSLTPQDYEKQPLDEYIKDYSSNNEKTAVVLSGKLKEKFPTRKEAEEYLKANNIKISNPLNNELNSRYPDEIKPETTEKAAEEPVKENAGEETQPAEPSIKDLEQSVWKKMVENPAGWMDMLTDEEKNLGEKKLQQIQKNAQSMIAASGIASSGKENKKSFKEWWQGVIDRAKPQKLSLEEKQELDAKEKEKAEKRKQQEEERSKEASQFLESHPSLVKSIFGKSGLTKGQRAMRLAELLSTIGANIFNGAYAGFKGQSLPAPVKGRWAEYYDKAFEKQAEREQTVKDEANKAQIDKVKKINYLNVNPTLKNYSDSTIEKLASNNNLSFSDFEKIIMEDESLSNIDNQDVLNQKIKDAYNAYKNSMSYNADVRNQGKEILEINGKRLENRKQFDDLITNLQSQKSELLKKKLENSSYTFEQAFKIIKSAVEPVKGIVSNAESLHEQTGFNWNVNASGGAGIKGIANFNVNGGAGGNKGKSSSASANVDVIGLEALLSGKIDASNWQKQAKQIIEEYNRAIDEAVDLVDKEIQELQNEKKNYINDGIVKGKGIAQKIVRADGTEIHLNPNDNILATTKDLTSSNDNGDEVVPMENEDKAYILQKRLGYADSPISKQFDYYLNRLRG